MGLNDVATVNVSTTSAGVTRQGFGVPLIVSHSAAWVERFRTYTTIAAVGVDFAANTPEYLAASKIFSQSPAVPSIMIGRAALQPTQQYSLGVVVAQTNTVYKARVGVPTGVVFVSQDASYNPGAGATVWSPSNTWYKGVLISNASGLFSCLGQSGQLGAATGIGGASGPTGTSAAFQENQVFWMYVGTGNTGAVTNDSVAAGVKAAIDILNSPPVSGTGLAQVTTSFTGTPLSRSVQLLANAPAAFFSVQAYSRAALSVVQNEADPGIATDLAAIKLASSAWYGLITLYNSDAIIAAAAAWVEANQKLYVAASNNSQIVTVADSTPATDVAHTVKANSYTKTHVDHHPSPDQFYDAGVMGKFFPISPGGETWRMKQISGVVSELYTDTETANARGKNAGYYYNLGGVDVVGGDAKTGFGDYIDVFRFIDWYTANLQADLANLLIQSNKVPQTNPGYDQIAAMVRKRNQLGIAAGGIAANPPPTVIMPDATLASQADRTAREVQPVQSTWTLAGAVHHITVNVNATH